MYYDLNIPWPLRPRDIPGKSKSNQNKRGGHGEEQTASSSADTLPNPLEGLSQQQREALRALTLDLSDLGFSTIAFNHIVQTRFDGAKHLNPFRPYPSGSPRPPFPDLDPRCRRVSDAKGKGRPSRRPTCTQLSRLTLQMDDETMGKQSHGLTSGNVNALLSYDLLAVQPTTEASFSAACLSLTELKPNSIDIISLDLAPAPRLPFFLKRSTVGAALNNGAVFEICYSRAVTDASGMDRQKARRNIISGTRDILRVTNGKGIIFSSGTADLLGIRGPYDVINLAAVFGMNPAAAKDAISSTCRSLLLRAETRKTFRGVMARPVIVSAIPHGVGGDAEPDPASDMGDVFSLNASKKRKAPPELKEESTDQGSPASGPAEGVQKLSKKKKKKHVNPSPPV